MSPDEEFARDGTDGCTVAIRVQPGAKRDAILGLHAGAIKIALTAPPLDGRANEALLAFLAERLGLPRFRLDLVAGASSRSKVVRITGKSAAEVQAALSPVREA
jgi:uncharacterized protein